MHSYLPTGLCTYIITSMDITCQILVFVSSRRSGFKALSERRQSTQRVTMQIPSPSELYFCVLVATLIRTPHRQFIILFRRRFTTLRLVPTARLYVPMYLEVLQMPKCMLVCYWYVNYQYRAITMSPSNRLTADEVPIPVAHSQAAFAPSATQVGLVRKLCIRWAANSLHFQALSDTCFQTYVRRISPICLHSHLPYRYVIDECQGIAVAGHSTLNAVP